MAASDSTTPSAQSLIDELDHAIAECYAMTGATESAASSESSIAVLKELKQCLLEVGEQPLDQLQLQQIRARVPLPAWLPRMLTDAFQTTDEISASQALSDAIRRPSQNDVSSPVSAVQRATSQSQGGSRANTPPPSKTAGPSGLMTAERIGGTSLAPSASTTILGALDFEIRPPGGTS